MGNNPCVLNLYLYPAKVYKQLPTHQILLTGEIQLSLEVVCWESVYF